MSARELIAEIKTLPDSERELLFEFLLEEQETREDLLDALTIQQREKEPSRPLEQVFTDLGIKP